MYKKLSKIFISVFGKENAIALYKNIIDEESNELSKIQKLIKLVVYPALTIPGFRRQIVKVKGVYDKKIITYTSDALNVTLNNIYNLPDVEIRENRPKTVNVLVPAFSIETISAGFFGVFNVAKLISSQGTNVRLVLFDNFYYNAMEFEKSLKNYPGIEDLFDIMEIEYIGSNYKPLYVSKEDRVVATVWYSAYFAKKIMSVINLDDPFLYLIQDYEAAFYPANSLHCLAHETYNMNYNALVSSETLFNFLIKKATRLGCWQKKSVLHISTIRALLEFKKKKSFTPPIQQKRKHLLFILGHL